MGRIKTALKRDGREVPFDKTKIADAIYKAAQAAGGETRLVAEDLADAVTLVLEKEYDGTPPHIERIQDLVERVLMETGHVETAKAYILYREKRARIRSRLKVRKTVPSPRTSQLMVSPGARSGISPWDREKIVLALEIEADLDSETAREIASAVERKVLASGITQISTSLIRELVDNELFSRGLAASLERQKMIGLPKFDFDEILFARTKTSHKLVANNPEAINLAIAEHSLRQYALEEVFEPAVAQAHLSGMIHIHDLGYPTRAYVIAHSLEFLKKYGLALETVDVCSAPAKYASTLTSQLSTFLGAMQAYASGPQSIDFLNILYAPYLHGLSEAEVRQEAQRLVFESAQHAFSRGGQTLFTDINIYPTTPHNIADVEAIGPGGKPTGRPYKAYEATAQLFARALLDVWKEGDRFGCLFCFPKCDFHVTPGCFESPEARALMEQAADIASVNGVPVFVMDRLKAPRLGPPLRMPWPHETRGALEGLRCAVIQSVTLNLPQAALRAAGHGPAAFLEEVGRAFDLAVQAHLQKRRFLARLAASPQLPLWQLGRRVRDGKPYVDLQSPAATVGMLGLNESLACVLGRELASGEPTLSFARELLDYLCERADQAGKKTGLHILLEETPSEHAAVRLANIDAKSFPAARSFVRGDPETGEAWYTNGVKIPSDAVLSLGKRVAIEGSLHPCIEVHPMSHAHLDSPGPSGKEILAFLKWAFLNTTVAQVAFSPVFTLCLDCRTMLRDEIARCHRCDSANVTGLTRIADYFSRTREWNRGMRAELRSRYRHQSID